MKRTPGVNCSLERGSSRKNSANKILIMTMIIMVIMVMLMVKTMTIKMTMITIRRLILRLYNWKPSTEAHINKRLKVAGVATICLPLID